MPGVLLSQERHKTEAHRDIGINVDHFYSNGAHLLSWIRLSFAKGTKRAKLIYRLIDSTFQSHLT